MHGSRLKCSNKVIQQFHIIEILKHNNSNPAKDWVDPKKKYTHKMLVLPKLCESSLLCARKFYLKLDLLKINDYCCMFHIYWVSMAYLLSSCLHVKVTFGIVDTMYYIRSMKKCARQRNMIIYSIKYIILFKSQLHFDYKLSRVFHDIQQLYYYNGYSSWQLINVRG